MIKEIKVKNNKSYSVCSRAILAKSRACPSSNKTFVARLAAFRTLRSEQWQIEIEAKLKKIACLLRHGSYEDENVLHAAAQLERSGVLTDRGRRDHT